MSLSKSVLSDSAISAFVQGHIPPVERGQREGLEGVGEGVGGGVVGVVDRGPPELDVRVQEAARAAANRLLDFSKLEGRERRRD